MSTPVKKSQIVEDGLRYKAKVSGSPFGETNQCAHTATMSCFLCGKHRPAHAAHDAQIAGQGAKRLCAEVRKIARTNSAHRPPAPICEYRAVARVGLEQSQDLIDSVSTEGCYAQIPVMNTL